MEMLGQNQERIGVPVYPTAQGSFLVWTGVENPIYCLVVDGVLTVVEVEILVVAEAEVEAVVEVEVGF